MDIAKLEENEKLLLKDIVSLFTNHYYTLINFNYDEQILDLTKKRQVKFDRKFIDKYIETLIFDIKSIIPFFVKQREFISKKIFANHIVQGNIIDHANNEYIISFNCKNMIGVLPNCFSLKSDDYQYKKSFWFYVQQVGFDIYDDYPIKLILSRISNRLPILLLKRYYSNGIFKCKTYPKEIVIQTNIFIKKEVISAVREATGKKVIIKSTKNLSFGKKLKKTEITENLNANI